MRYKFKEDTYKYFWFQEFEQFCVINFKGQKHHVNFLLEEYIKYLGKKEVSNPHVKEVKKANKTGLWTNFKTRGYKVSDCDCEGRVTIE